MDRSYRQFVAAASGCRSLNARLTGEPNVNRIVDVKIVIVGGGIFGITGAMELAARGHEVVVIDQGTVPDPDASSTDISKVIRMDYGADEFYTSLMERALMRWREWNQRWDRARFHETGFLVMSSRVMAAGFEHDSYHLIRSRGHDVERLNSALIGVRFPAWASAGFVDGYFNPQGGWAESGEVVRCLADECRALGVEIRGRCRALNISRGGSAVCCVITEAGEINADAVVVAAGAWSSRLIPELRECIQPIAQSVVHFGVHDAGQFQAPYFPTWTADVATSGWYGFSALDDGTLKIANHGPGELVAPDARPDVTPRRVEDFRSFLRTRLPEIAQIPVVRTRTCLYSDSWDGDFYIDRVPSGEGVFVATGGSGHAFKFAPILGELIADRLERRQNKWLERFCWRSPGSRRFEPARYS